MDFKKLNEELKKFVEKEINEISDSTVSSVDYERRKNLRAAKDNYLKGSGSLDTLTNAGKKLDNFKDLKTKRTARRTNNIKHVIIDADVLPQIRDGKTTLKDSDIFGLTDEDLIRLANREKNIMQQEKVISTLEEAKNVFSSASDNEYKIAISKHDLFRTSEPSFDTGDADSQKWFYILLDTSIEDAKAQINGTGEKNRKKLQKYANYGKNLMKYVEKGEVEDFEWSGTENGHRNFYYSVRFKNPGWPDQETFRENTKDWKDKLVGWRMPKPEPRIEGTYLTLYSNFVEHKGHIFMGDNNTIVITGIVGFERED